MASWASFLFLCGMGMQTHGGEDVYNLVDSLVEEVAMKVEGLLEQGDDDCCGLDNRFSMVT